MARREDVVGALQESSSRRGGGFFGSASSSSSRSRLPAAGTKTIFTLGTRHLLLTDSELFLAPVIVPHEGPQQLSQSHEEKVWLCKYTCSKQLAYRFLLSVFSLNFSKSVM